jgi:alpha-glucosidase
MLDKPQLFISHGIAILSSLLVMCGRAAMAQKNAIRLTSPNGQIVFTFRINDTASYNVSYKNRPIIANSSISFSFLETGDFKNNLRTTKPVFRRAEENYELIVGKSRFVRDPFQEVVIPIQQTKPPYTKINLQVRAFDGGIAFRYEFPAQKNLSEFFLTDEHTHFKLAGDPDVLALLLPNYTTSHEGEYTHCSFSTLREDTLLDMPALFTFPGPVYLAITEAALLDYAGMYLGRKRNVLTSKLSPLPGQAQIKVKAKLPHYSPWRVLLISDRIGALIESNILTSLNEPCKIKDLSWIKPGKTTFPWWNGNVVPDTLNAPGNNFVTNQYYIDFCARNGLQYHSVVEYGLHQWYVDDGVNFQPGPHADVTTPVPGLDMKQICDYAKERGVDIRVWVHWAALYPKLDTAFAVFEKWGIKGMMVDFMDRDDQQMVNMQTEIVQKAAEHHLHIQFHGAYKPTGLSRTWPNEFTREGTLNYEVNKWDKRITPDHDLNIVFTRMLAGPTDYHLGGFRAVADSLFKIQYTRPLMLGTRCHMLAMYVVLENPLGMVCDYPAAYEGQPGFEFIKEVPTTWDATKVLDAKVGEYIVIARKKGSDWFAGAITNHSERLIDIPLNFLDEAKYVAEIYSDTVDVNVEPNHLQQQNKNVTNKDILPVRLAAGGGMAIRFRKMN